MHDCQRYHDLIAAYVAGDIDLTGLEDLVTHCRGCADCRGIVEMHRSLAAAAPEVAEPSAEVLDAVRTRVLDQLEESRAGRGLQGRAPSSVVAPRPPFWRAVTDWLAASPIPAPVLAVLLMLAAGLAGRWTATPHWSDASLLRAVEDQAGQAAGLEGFWDATFTFANVAVRQTGGRDLALGFDACRHVETVTPRNSPLAREVLLSTILDSPTLGVRLKAMDLAPDLQDARLQQALIYTLHNDPDLAVRLEALAALSRPPLDAARQDALLTTLRDDASVELRLRTLEVLVTQRVDPEAILQAASGAEQGGNAAIMQLATEMVGGS